MNANELADELDKLKSEYLVWEWTAKAQAMLRKIGNNCACGEPLAPNTVHRKDSPCYVKEELTEEKILSIANKYEENMDSFGTRIGIPKEDIIDFARAILRKAQEK